MGIVVQNFDLSQITTALYVMQITAELSFALTPLFIRNASPPNKRTLQLHDTPIPMRHGASIILTITAEDCLAFRHQPRAIFPPLPGFQVPSR